MPRPKPSYKIAHRIVIRDQDKDPYYRILRMFLYRKVAAKPLSKFQIQGMMEDEKRREEPLSYATIHSTVKRLKSDGLLKIADTGLSRRQDVIEYYDLTCDGLFQALHSAVVLKKNLNWRDIAVNYASYVPLVFAKWDYFVQTGTEETAIQRLEMIFHRPVVFDPEEGIGPILLQERLPAEFLFQTGFSRRPHAPSRWLSVISHDRDLLVLATQVAERRYERAREIMKIWKEYSNIFKKRLLTREEPKPLALALRTGKPRANPLRGEGG